MVFWNARASLAGRAEFLAGGSDAVLQQIGRRIHEQCGARRAHFGKAIAPDRPACRTAGAWGFFQNRRRDLAQLGKASLTRQAEGDREIAGSEKDGVQLRRSEQFVEIGQAFGRFDQADDDQVFCIRRR